MLAYLEILNSFSSGIYMDDIADMICQIHHVHLYKYLILENMIKISDIFVSITVSLLQLIYIIWVRKNTQTYLLPNYNYNNISTKNQKREILQTFMSAFCLYVTSSLTLVYL